MIFNQIIDKLRKAIVEGDTVSIEQAFEDLSGEKISFGGETLKVEPVNSSSIDEIFDDDFTMRPQNKDSSTARVFVNEFDPSTTPENTKSELDEYNKIDDNVTPMKRSRPPHTKVDVFCQNCQKNILVDPMFKKDPYYCDYVKSGKSCINM